MTHDWDNLKKSIVKRWDKITHKDLDEIHKKKSGLLALLKRHYPHDHTIPLVLEAILEAHGEWFYEHNPTAPRPSETSELQDDLGNFHIGPEVEVYALKVEEFSRTHTRDHASDTRPL